MGKINTKKLVLGTAQLEGNYGISNISGNKNKKEAFKILETAFKYGIRHIDTAPGYNSETTIGKFISAHGLTNEIKVFTKIPSLKKKKDIEKFVVHNIERSLKNLKIDIHTLYLHDSKDIDLFKRNIKFFKRIKKIFPIKHLGFSIYSLNEINKTSALGFLPSYQVPFNILDQSFINLKIQNKNIVGRSIFLQGLLINRYVKKKKLPKTLIDSHKKYLNYLKQLRIDPLVFQLSFINNTKFFDKFIVGVDNNLQLKEIINCNLYKKVNKEIINKINSFFQKKDIDPRKWKII